MLSLPGPQSLPCAEKAPDGGGVLLGERTPEVLLVIVALPPSPATVSLSGVSSAHNGFSHSGSAQ